MIRGNPKATAEQLFLIKEDAPEGRLCVIAVFKQGRPRRVPPNYMDVVPRAAANNYKTVLGNEVIHKRAVDCYEWLI